jgi:hypothetical protein
MLWSRVYPPDDNVTKAVHASTTTILYTSVESTAVLWSTYTVVTDLRVQTLRH